MDLPRICAAAAACSIVTACGGGGNGFDPNAPAACGVAAEKQLVLDATRQFYLFLELLPASIDAAQFATADDLLNSMTATARSQQKDRFFSFLTSITAEQQFFAAGESIGFGFSRMETEASTRVFVTQVFEGSAADDASFARGDEILQIGTSASTLVDVSTLLQTPNGLVDALGPNETGVSRAFRMRTLSGMEEVRIAAKRAFSLEPVPDVRMIPRSGLSPVGYINFRTFVSPAEAELRNAFTQFRQAPVPVQDVIIDLRYNGGGLVATAEVLGSLLAQQAAAASSLMHRTQFNANRPSIDVNFRVEAQAMEPVSIVFLTTEGSASASELVINSLGPYARVAIVGQKTHGKPVGQEAFDLQGCDTRLRLVTFKLVNRDGFGDYFTGLPDANFADDFCEAADDLSAAQGAETEEMTSVALSWITSGQCPTVSPKAGAEIAAAAKESALIPPPGRPSPAQVFQPGLT